MNERKSRLTSLITLAGTGIWLAGCSAHPEPIVDMQGVDQAMFEIDLAECKSYAEPIRIEKGAAKGAVGGAVIGAATGAISGNVAEGAGYGGIWGAVRCGEEADRDKRRVVKRCLGGRGYRVLN